MEDRFAKSVKMHITCVESLFHTPPLDKIILSVVPQTTIDYLANRAKQEDDIYGDFLNRHSSIELPDNATKIPTQIIKTKQSNSFLSKITRLLK
jgi:hypothetical protein